jgi:protein-arginine kinase activator protein McsA
LKEKAKTFEQLLDEYGLAWNKAGIKGIEEYTQTKWVRLEDTEQEIERILILFQALISKAEKDCADCYQELKQKLQQFKRSLEIQLDVLKSKPHHSETETQLEIMLNEFKEEFEGLLQEAKT